MGYYSQNGLLFTGNRGKITMKVALFTVILPQLFASISLIIHGAIGAGFLYILFLIALTITYLILNSKETDTERDYNGQFETNYYPRRAQYNSKPTRDEYYSSSRNPQRAPRRRRIYIRR